MKGFDFMFDITDDREEQFLQEEQNRLDSQLGYNMVTVVAVYDNSFGVTVQFKSVKGVLRFLKKQGSVRDFKRNSKYAMYELVDSELAFDCDSSVFGFV